MRLYKPLTRWWDPTHGGEYRAHVDFVVEAPETFAEAVWSVFRGSPDSYWNTPVDAGRVRKVHLELAVFEMDDE